MHQGNKDPENIFQKHFALIVKHCFLRIQLKLSASNGKEATSDDVNLPVAFTEGPRPNHTIYIPISKDFWFTRGTAMKLERYLYDTSEAGDV